MLINDATIPPYASEREAEKYAHHVLACQRDRVEPYGFDEWAINFYEAAA